MDTARRRTPMPRTRTMLASAIAVAGFGASGVGCAAPGVGPAPTSSLRSVVPARDAAPSADRWSPGPSGLVTHRLAGLDGPQRSRRDADLGYPPRVPSIERTEVRVDRSVNFRTTPSGSVRTWSNERIRERRWRSNGG